MVDLVTRISADELSQYQNWSIPEVGSSNVVPGVTEKRKVNQHRKKDHQEITGQAEKNEAESILDEEVDEHQVTSLTAEQLEAITKEAEKDGYNSGFEKGYEEAKEKGYQEGLNEAKVKVAEECQRLSQLTQALLIPLDSQQAELEKQLLDMICLLVRAVVERELKTDSSDIVNVVKQSLMLLPSTHDTLNLYLNRQDIELIQSNLTEVPENLQYQVDDSLLPGGCRLENAQSSLDDSVESRLKEVLDGFVNKRFADVDEDVPLETVHNRESPQKE